MNLILRRGITFAQKLRADGDYRTEIVFVSAHTSYSMRLFAVQPMNFIVRSIEETQVKAVLAEYIKKHPENDVFRCRIGTKQYNISYDDIIFVETAGKKRCDLYTVSGVLTLPLFKSFKSFAAELPEYRFLKAGSSCYVNRSWIRYIDGNEIYLNPQEVFDRVLYISRSEIKPFYKKYME